MFKTLRSMTLWFAILFLANCGATKTGRVLSSLAQRTWTENDVSPLERAYCRTPIIYNEFYTISGKAEYEYREINTELNERGLDDIADTPRPIRHAQYEVVDALGKILQCGETDGSGGFSIRVPQNEKALTLNIYSRSDNNFARASVFRAPETNELYLIQRFFTANRNQTNFNLLAEGDGDLLGGAFNILDQIHNAIDRLKNLTQASANLGINPEQIPKAEIYWEAGFNPGIYIGVDSGISFLSKAQRKLFILGGIEGDTEFMDTDHFDNSIILHEYFHFLESAVSRADSPGGPHSGNELLDPRLAWSEGAAQFFQALITDIPAVFDTRGNNDGDTGFALKYSIEDAVIDIPDVPGEGNLREFAVARLLWDFHDSEVGEQAPEAFDPFEPGLNYFSRIWEVFSGTSGSTIQTFKGSPTEAVTSELLLTQLLANIPSIGVLWTDLLTESGFTVPSFTASANSSAQSQKFSHTSKLRKNLEIKFQTNTELKINFNPNYKNMRLKIFLKKQKSKTFLSNSIIINPNSKFTLSNIKDLNSYDYIIAILEGQDMTGNSISTATSYKIGEQEELNKIKEFLKNRN